MVSNQTIDYKTQIASLKEDLAGLRSASLRATREGDYKAVARLGIRTAHVNEEIKNLMALQRAEGDFKKYA